MTYNIEIKIGFTVVKQFTVTANDEASAIAEAKAQNAFLADKAQFIATPA